MNELLDQYILDIESKKAGNTKREYIQKYLKGNTNDSLLNVFVKKTNLDRISELKRTLNSYDLDSKKGKELVLENYHQLLLETLIDSLRLEYKLKTFLEPPSPPMVSLEQIQTYYRGNLESKITLLEVSDMECGKCREHHPVYQKIYAKYKDRVRFGFSHFSSYPTLSAIATNSAAKQNKFWQMHDSIMAQSSFLDTAEIYNLASNLGLDLNQFERDFHDPEIPSTLKNNNKLIKQFGLFGTPTILINGTPIFDSSSQEEIEKLIEAELRK
jgi:predicted DsbA family dithiol-disulfide isomerase